MLQQVRLESWSMHSSREPRIGCQPYFVDLTDLTWHFGYKAVTSRDNGENVFKPLSSEATAEKPACLEKFISKESSKLKFSYSTLFTYQAKRQRAWSRYIKRLCNSVPQDVIAVSLFFAMCFPAVACMLAPRWTFFSEVVPSRRASGPWCCEDCQNGTVLDLGLHHNWFGMKHPKVSPIRLHTCGGLPFASAAPAHELCSIWLKKH